jgi:hypothetical protein
MHAFPESCTADGKLAVKLSAQDTQQLKQLLDSVTTVVLDCDGVLWRGSTLMPGTVEVGCSRAEALGALV